MTSKWATRWGLSTSQVSFFFRSARFSDQHFCSRRLELSRIWSIRSTQCSKVMKNVFWFLGIRDSKVWVEIYMFMYIYNYLCIYLCTSIHICAFTNTKKKCRKVTRDALDIQSKTWIFFASFQQKKILVLHRSSCSSFLRFETWVWFI